MRVKNAIINFPSALGSLIPDASEAGNEVLIGEYFQAGIFLFTISAIPVILLWSIGTESAFLWLGFDLETAQLGQGFACSYVFAEVIRGVDECLHVLLSFKGKEYYSTFVHTFSCFTKPFAVFVMVERRDLVATGALQLALATCVTIGNFIIVGRNKWLGRCWDGFVGRLAIFVSRESLICSNRCFWLSRSLTDFLTYLHVAAFRMVKSLKKCCEQQFLLVFLGFSPSAR